MTVSEPSNKQERDQNGLELELQKPHDEDMVHSSSMNEHHHTEDQDNDDATRSPLPSKESNTADDSAEKHGATAPLLVSPDANSDPDVTQKESKEEEEDDGVPYDRGWAWVALFGLFVNFVLLSGYLKSSGLFFVELLRRFNAPATHTALLFAIRAGIFSVSGVYVMNVLLARFGSRKLVITGGVCMAMSAILSSFANNLTLLICIHSLLLAFGMVMVISPGEVLIGRYFKKRRSLALSLAKCGASVGNITVPPLITYLLGEYGLTGTLLLYGAICFHSVPAGMLFRPLSFFTKRHHRHRRVKQGKTFEDRVLTTETDRNGSEKTQTVRQNGVRNGEVKEEAFTVVEIVEVDSDGGSKSERSLQLQTLQKPFQDGKKIRDLEVSFQPCEIHTKSIIAKIPESENFDVVELTKSNPELGRFSTGTPLRQRTFSELKSKYQRQVSEGSPNGRILEAISQSSVVKYMSAHSLDVLPYAIVSPTSSETIQNEDTKRLASDRKDRGCQSCFKTDNKNQNNATSCCRQALKCVLQCPKNFILALDFSLFRKPLFRLFMVYVMFSPIVNITLDYLPAVSSENGVSESQASLLLSIIGGLDLVCRASSGFIADLKVLSVSTMIITAAIILGIVTQFVRFMTSFEHFVVFAVLQGLFGGVGNCLFPVLVIEFVGLENMGKGIGFCQLISGMSLSAIYPFLGYIRDITGSYAIVYHLIGCGTIIAAILLCCERPIRRMEERSLRKKQEHESLPDTETVVDAENDV